jgi:hypothetical protein
MRQFCLVCLFGAALNTSPLAGSVVPGRWLQQRDTTRADSAARARADSLRLVRELEALGRDTTVAPRAQGTGQAGPTNPRFLPDVSAIGEFIGDFTSRRSTQETGRRFDIREVELAIQAAVDPYFRADIILGLSDEEGIAIEESYLTAIRLPGGLQGRLGRFHMPIGKLNTTHRAELLGNVEYPYVIQRFLGPEGGKGTGLWLSGIFAPLGFYQEVQVTVVDGIGESEEELVAEPPSNATAAGLGYSLRLRNYLDLSESSNLELSGSLATSRRAQPILCDGEAACAGFDGTPAANARQSLIGADVTFRWRPLQQGLYRSFMLQAEFIRQVNQDAPSLPEVPGTTVTYAGPVRGFSGAYLFGRYQVGRRSFVGARGDWVEDPEGDGDPLRAASVFVQFFPSEFSKFVLGFERTMPKRQQATNRLLLQSTFAVGPHRPHPF